MKFYVALDSRGLLVSHATLETVKRLSPASHTITDADTYAKAHAAFPSAHTDTDAQFWQACANRLAMCKQFPVA